jgi:hypothetical protein
MCAANRRRRVRGRPRRMQSASAGSALGLAGVVGRSTTGIAGGRCRRWTTCADTEARRLGRRRRTRILGKDTSHFAGAGSGARAVILVDEGIEFDISAGRT